MAFREKMANAHPLLKGVLWLGIMALLFVVTMVGYVVYVQLTGVQSVQELKMAQLVQSVMVFVVPALLAVWCWSCRPAEWLRLRAVGNCWVYAIVVVLMIVAQPGINMLATWNEGFRLPAFMSEIEQYFQDMEASARELTEMLAAAPTIGALLLNLVVLAAVPALGEELTFRGVLLGLTDGDTTLGARI